MSDQPVGGAPDFDDATQASTSEPRQAARIGSYRLIQRLGEGGMGEVWLAEQTQPLRRHVALKIIKAGMDTAQVVARFEAERQALAVMDHPAIAHVFDAGATPHGRPYFAMEYVRGESITSYSKKHKLLLRGRLDLFLQVCDGVQHAHQKGIIHRDLKPSNILVTVPDGHAVPKIIDFGVAKATTRQLTEHTLHTEFGLLIGTPEYMSPEQAEMTGLDIDTRTDVYALGVILYELLTGVLPFDDKTLREKPLDEIRRIIRDVDPPRPSTRVTTFTAAPKSVDDGAIRSHASAAELRGDLDWITMRALEKDRTRRYGSASDLAGDLRRHLDNLPVMASPPSTAYRVRKFVRRHRSGVAIGGAVIALLIAFAITMGAQASRIARERNRANREAEVAQQVSEFLVGLFNVSNPSEARGNSLTAREILDKGVQQIDAALSRQPETQARMLETLGTVYSALGLYEPAERLLKRAVGIERLVLGPRHVSTLITLRKIAWVLSVSGRNAEADGFVSDAISKLRETIGEEHLDTIMAERILVGIRRRQGRMVEAEDMSTQLRPRATRVLGNDHPEVQRILNDLANIYSDTGRYAESAAMNEKILDIRRRLLGNRDPETLATMNNLAVQYQALGRFSEAKKLLEEVVAAGQIVLGPRHPYYGTFVHSLGELMLATGDLNAADTQLRRALDIYRSQSAPEYVGLVLYELAQIQAKQHRRDEALKLLGEALGAGYMPQGTTTGIAGDPALASLHDDPRFQKLLAEQRERKPKPLAR